MNKEQILDKVATRLMREWNMDTFKITHKRLFDVIMESMDEYAGVQVKKLNIDDVSKCYLCNIKIAPPKHLCGDCYEDSINK